MTEIQEKPKSVKVKKQVETNLFKNIFDLDKGFINVKNIKKPKKLNYIEIYDSNKLAFILNDLSEVKKTYRPEARDDLCLETYYNASKFNHDSNLGFKNNKYTQKNNDLYTRMYGSITGQGMVREVRSTIFKDYYNDLDINNAHPVITKWICDNIGLECIYISKYIENRENVFDELITLNPEYTRGKFKQIFLAIMYGGVKDFNKLPVKNDFIINFKNEIQSIHNKFSKVFFNFYKIVKKLAEDKDMDYNIPGKNASQLCGFVENQLLQYMISYVKDKLPEDKFNNTIMCFDGLMFRSGLIDNKEMIHDLEKIYSDMGIPLKLSIKDFCSLDLESMGYDNSIKYKYESIEKPKEEKKEVKIDYIPPNIDIPEYNTFNEDKYYFNDLCRYFDNNIFYGLNSFKPVQYLIENLHRVLVIVNRNVIIKISKNEFFKISKFKDFTEQKIHYIVIVMNVEKDVYVDLGTIINQNKKYFKLFNAVKSDFYFNCPDKDTFIISRQFIAKYNSDYLNSEKLKVLLSFIKINLFSNKEEMFNYEMDKLSIMVKYPHLKTGIITLLISVLTGCGKNLYTDFLCNYVFGDYNTISNLSGLETLLDDKNGMQFGMKMVVVNEMSSTQDKFMSNFTKFKNMITETKQRIRFMYTDGFMADQSTEYYCLSNHKNSYIIENKKSRREFVPDIDESYADNKTYFAPIRKNINNQECGDMFYSYLINRNITYDEFMLKTVPMSKTKIEIVNNYKPDIIELVEYIEKYDIVEDSEIWYLSKIYSRFRQYCEENGLKCLSNKKCASILKNYGYIDDRDRNGINFILNKKIG